MPVFLCFLHLHILRKVVSTFYTFFNKYFLVLEMLGRRLYVAVIFA
jgi:hypothetical protein